MALGSPCWQHHPEQAALKIGILPHLPVAQVVQVAQVAQLALVALVRLQMKKPVLFQVSRCPFPIISWSGIVLYAGNMAQKNDVHTISLPYMQSTPTPRWHQRNV